MSPRKDAPVHHVKRQFGLHTYTQMNSW
jgi:hypothetical protein